MTTATRVFVRLEFDLADRMRKALRVADMGVGEMAEYLGVSRNTVGNWINGHATPSRQTRMLWAMRTSVPLEWLETGNDPDDPSCPRQDSNLRPTRYKVVRGGQRVASFEPAAPLRIAS